MSDLVNKYIQDIKDIPNLTKKEERALLIKAQQGGIDSRNKLIRSHLKLVVTIANRYKSAIKDVTIQYLDLVQAGNLGLFRAVKEIDLSKGCRFTTFATFTIRNSILNLIMDTEADIRRPRVTQEILLKIDKYIKKHNCKPVAATIAKETSRNESLVQYILDTLPAIYGGNARTGTQELTEYTRATEDQSTINKCIIDKCLSYVSDKERDVLIQTYLEGKTLAEMSKEQNKHYQCIQQIRDRAIRKIRKHV